jgi:hypothetical protein
MIHQRFFALSCGTLSLLADVPGMAAAPNGISATGSGGSAGVFSFVEWNPAALKEKTVQLNGEYLILDGVAFGTLVKVTDVNEDGVELRTFALGGTVTQYFFSQTLDGLFLRGDVSVFLDQYKVVGSDPSLSAVDRSIRVQDSGYNTGASLGLLGGYRAKLTEHITGSAGYGVVRNLPDFFRSGSAGLQSRYAGFKGDWRFEVQVGVGVSF